MTATTVAGKFMTDSDLQAAYLRITSIAIAGYDYLITLPAEYRFYTYRTSRSKSESAPLFGRRRGRDVRQRVKDIFLNQQCILFILIRYVSAITLTLNAVGFFGHFSIAACGRYYMLAPLFKVLQTMVSQVILASRAYTISRRAAWVRWMLAGLLLLVVPGQFVSTVYKRQPLQSTGSNCTSSNIPGVRIAWVFYLCAFVFDLVTIGVSTAYLRIYSSDMTRLSHLLRRMLYEGLGYFILLSAVNVLNMIIYRSRNQSVQTSAASMGYVVTWIMSQRILINQRETSRRYKREGIDGVADKSRSHSLNTSHEINRALRSQFDATKSQTTFSRWHSAFTGGGFTQVQTLSMAGGLETQREGGTSASSPVVVIGKREYALARDERKRGTVCDGDPREKELSRASSVGSRLGKEREGSGDIDSVSVRQDRLGPCKEEDERDDGRSSDYSVHVRIERNVEVHYDDYESNHDEHRRPHDFWRSRR